MADWRDKIEDIHSVRMMPIPEANKDTWLKFERGIFYRKPEEKTYYMSQDGTIHELDFTLKISREEEEHWGWSKWRHTLSLSKCGIQIAFKQRIIKQHTTMNDLIKLDFSVCQKCDITIEDILGYVQE